MTGANVWVLGGTGMVGQAVCAALKRLGHTSTATGSEVDICDADAVRARALALGPSHIINCAAMTQVDLCETEASRAMAVNGTGPGNVAQAARAVGAQALHISTDYVFDGAVEAPRLEHHPVGPTSQYGHSKLAGERAFLAALDGYDAPHFVVRTSWVFGPGGANFVSTMLRLMGERETVQVVADQHGRPTYSQDLARAILSLMGLEEGATQACPSGVYHFANGGTTTWHGLCVEVLSAAQVLGHPVRCQRVEPVSTEAFPRPAKRPAYSILGTEKFEQAAQWTPQPFVEAVAHYLSSVSSP